MSKRKKLRPSQREVHAQLRAQVGPEIVRLEKRYGETAVSAAFSRHQQIRRERRKLERQRDEANERIAKLRT